MKVHKKKPVITGIIFNSFEIGTSKPMTFLKDLEKLCKKYAANKKTRKDFSYSWEITSE